MGTLEEFVNSLPINKQKEVALYFCRIALPIWEDWAKKHTRQLAYRDSVIYMFHKTLLTLLRETI
jgi:CMP-2-keto-3-deoxyoctulosonic acid synthetase